MLFQNWRQGTSSPGLEEIPRDQSEPREHQKNDREARRRRTLAGPVPLPLFDAVIGARWPGRRARPVIKFIIFFSSDIRKFPIKSLRREIVLSRGRSLIGILVFRIPAQFRLTVTRRLFRETCRRPTAGAVFPHAFSGDRVLSFSSRSCKPCYSLPKILSFFAERSPIFAQQGPGSFRKKGGLKNRLLFFCRLRLSL